MRKVDREKVSARPFSQSEKAIVVMICEGLSQQEIAVKMGIKYSSVRTYVSRMLCKTKTHNSVGLVIYCFRRGIINCPCGLSKVSPKSELDSPAGV